MMVLGNFRCRASCFFLIMVGQGPFVVAVGARGRGSGGSHNVSLDYHFFSLSLD